MPVVSELIQAKLTPLFPNYYGPLTSITTPQWHYISGGKAGEELFRCCTNAPELDNLANTDEGQRVCQGFKKELEVTEKRNPTAGGIGSPHSPPAPRSPSISETPLEPAANNSYSETGPSTRIRRDPGP